MTTVAHLNVRAKCHPCRFKTEKEDVTCHLCEHKYTSPGGSAMRAMRDAFSYYTNCNDTGKINFLAHASELGKFVCPRCVEHPKDMIVVIPVMISYLISQNMDIEKLIPISDYEFMMKKNEKLWKKVIAVKVDQMKEDQNYSGFDLN